MADLFPFITGIQPDGLIWKFKIEEKDNNLHWKGSANQRVIDVKASLRAGEVRLYQE